MERSSSCDTCAAFLVGLFTGAVAALLLAPQSGKESRAMVGEVAGKLKERVAEAKQEMMQQKSGEAHRSEGSANQVGRVTEPL